MNIVFMGTPEFSVPSLEKLIEKFQVKAVFTQPDKQRGRGKKVSFSAVKEAAVKHNIEVIQPKSLRKDREAVDRLKEINPDFIVVVAYGQILSKEVLDIPKYACVNLHASLLPKYRGAAPIQWAVVDGEEKSGNTTMLMDVGLDTGDMLLKQEVEITKDMTAGELHDILMVEGADLLIDTLIGLKEGSITPEKQDDAESCYASMLNKKTGLIDWEQDSKKVHDLIRGLNPWPMAYTYYEEKVMKIYKSEPTKKEHNHKPGTIINVHDNDIEVACGKGTLVINRVQFPGKKALDVKDYLRGNKIIEGALLKREL